MKDSGHNVKFCYLYRDGANYKNFKEIIFSNPIERNIIEIEKLVRDKLIDGLWFYSKEWNIHDLHFNEFLNDTEIDVTWHEFEGIELTSAEVTEQNSIEDFLVLVNKTKVIC